MDSRTGEPPAELNRPFLGNIRLSSHPEVIVRCKHRGGDRNRLARVEWFTPDGVRLLLSHPELDAESGAHFAYPKELDQFEATEFCVAWDGRRLSILAWSGKGSPWGARETALFEISNEGIRHRSIEFPISPEVEERITAARSSCDTFRFPHPDPRGLIPVSNGYVITGRGMGGFWFIDNSRSKELSRN